ncbi:MAG: dTTP/UTP pyrophosphatase [Candidatus Celerinatantimonas neptuna]|nr:MAG: dTTP/UTP pyrophosphatase [Candidatus Celerinatantimonas neptuna]
MDFYLASTSERRVQLLGLLDYQFRRIDGTIDERIFDGEMVHDYVLRMALNKARCGLEKVSSGHPVLGADTVISCDGGILGKPQDQHQSLQMLRRLSDRTHQVLTAVAVVTNTREQHCIVTTDVTMRAISDDEMIRYWHSGEPVDKAGSYAIQGIGGKFIASIHGSYSAVVGLPLVESEYLLKKFVPDCPESKN